MNLLLIIIIGILFYIANCLYWIYKCVKPPEEEPTRKKQYIHLKFRNGEEYKEKL